MNRSGGVTTSDIAQTKANSGVPVTGANFTADVVVSGTINTTDVAFVKSRSGAILP